MLYIFLVSEIRSLCVFIKAFSLFYVKKVFIASSSSLRGVRGFKVRTVWFVIAAGDRNWGWDGREGVGYAGESKKR